VAGVALENPVSLTAWWTLVIRYDDAVSDRPIAGDTFAHLFVNDEARAVAERFRGLTKPNASLPVRHRLIDESLASELARNPDLRVVVLGCGFDSRPFRLRGGHWVEVDEPGLLTYKESRLPSSDAANELVRVPIRFGEESLGEKLAPYATADRTAIVLEGIFGYLNDGERRELLSTLTRLFRRHIVFCDLLTRTFLARYSRKLVKRLRELGAEFTSSSDTPEALFHELGYRTVDRVSIFLSAAERGAKGAPPAWLVRRLPGLRDGYCVWALEYSPE
jgi:methyltransferase (TIGR00027 family)